MSMSPRQRMLAAYTGQPVDQIPVAPEFWYYIPRRVLEIPMYQLELEVPHWQALQQTFKKYGCEGWGIVQPGVPKNWGYQQSTTTHRLSDDRLESISIIQTKPTSLTARSIYDSFEPSWQTERYIKDFHLDWPIYEYQVLVPPENLDWKPVSEALEAVGDDYLLEVFVGFPFIDFAGEQREGGLAQVIADLYDHPEEMEQLQRRYVNYLVAKTAAVFEETDARSVFIASIWSTLSLLSPKLWRKWDKPVLESVIQATHECGGLVHHHFHGKCLGILDDLAELGLDCICPFERPPGGDITDLMVVRKALGDRTTFNGNVSTVKVLANGTPTDVQDEVDEILQSFADSTRVIVGTGDQVAAETPDENIYMMIETVKNHKTTLKHPSQGLKPFKG